MKLLYAALVASYLATPAYAVERMGSGEADLNRLDPMLSDRFRLMDTNGDGMVTRQENMLAANRIFDSSDTNKDGVLTEQEMTGQQKNSINTSMGVGKDIGLIPVQRNRY